ncbi:MAG: CobW family GTP-binding protein [Acidobacteriota bacterium]
MKVVPVNIISGPLGVGKTTVIRHLLENRPEGERWAVLVNEFGLVGLDAALLANAGGPTRDGKPGIEVKEVAGGCICCSAGFVFEVALAMLLRRKPDRLLIEPTGLAALSGILDALDGEFVRDKVDVRSTICMLDPATVAEDRQREEVADQIEAADVLLASRRDLATPDQLEAFTSWAESLFPKKQHVGAIERGQIAVAMLDLVSDRQTVAPRGDYQHGTDHHHHHHPDDDENHATPAEDTPDASRPIVRRNHISPVTSTIGWVCWKGVAFDVEKVARFLAELMRMPHAQRTKAVLHTNDGWWSFNFTPDARDAELTAYRRDSRIEAIFHGDTVPDLDALDNALRQCIVQD